MRYFLDIYREESILFTAEIFSDTVFSAVVNGEDKVTATLKAEAPVNLMRKDYILVNGIRYVITKWVDLSIDHEYTYGAVFHSTSYNLFAKPFLSSSGLSTFTILGTITEHLNALLYRINTVDSGWTAGTIEDDGRIIEIQYVKDDCRSALGKMFTEFGLEVYYILKQINLVKRFTLPDAPLVLAYGQGNGLGKLSKKIDGEFFTRVRGFGSTKNIPANYRGGLERLTFDPGYIDIEDAASYGDPVEIEVVFEDIFPRRTGMISSVESLFELADSSIDFNLGDNFITGETPRIVMDSGHWKGSEFEIITTSYRDETKSFKIKPNSEAGFSFPNSTLPIQTGDTYKFIGINLPQPYIDVAELEVQANTEGYASATPKLDVTYTLELNPIDILSKGYVGQLKLGRKVHVTHIDASIDVNMRITSITYPMIAPELAVAVISDKVAYSEEQQIKRIIIDSAKQVTVLKENIKKLKAFTNVRLDETLQMIFDPSGEYFDVSNIRPRSIETLFIATGARSQTFSLGVHFDTKADNNPNKFSWTAGKLTHFTVVPGTPYTWNIPSGSISSLVPETAYYIYAKCNRGNDNGVIVLDTAQRLIESDSTYYYFLVGTVSSVIDGYRLPDLSYGAAKIHGGFFSGEAILSNDGTKLIDIRNKAIIGNIKFIPAGGGSPKPITELQQEILDTYQAVLDVNDNVLDEVEARITLANSLKAMAFEDKVEFAKLGTTVIEGGYLKNTLIDTITLRAVMVTAEYVEGLELNFVRGTIGGNEIASNGILGAKFAIIDGKIWAEEAELDNITVDGLNAVNANITGTLKTSDGVTTSTMSAAGLSIYNGAYGGVAFKNNGENIITGSYLNLTVDAVFVNGVTALASETLDFGGGKSIGIRHGYIVSKSGF